MPGREPPPPPPLTPACAPLQALELMGGSSAGADPEPGLRYLSRHCGVAVVTLGERGCLVGQRGSEEVIAQPACTGLKVRASQGRASGWGGWGGWGGG